MPSNRTKQRTNTISICGIAARFGSLDSSTSFTFAGENYRWFYICRRRA